jgi:peptidoglycan glycosyltransferase
VLEPEAPTRAHLQRFLTRRRLRCYEGDLVSATGPGRGRLGGLGALFFLGTLGAIAFYVQRQELPEERDLVRKSATVVEGPTAEEVAPPTLPWNDRLDLRAAALVPFAGIVPAALADGSEPPKVDPAQARLVQDLGDGHRILLTIDPVLQDAALTIFKNREVPYAAAVMLDVEDNAVLAMVGHSTMDPDVDPLAIVTQAWAPAASTFKLVTAAALMDVEAATASTRVCFNGGLHGIEDDQLRDDPARDTRCETLADAVAHSYNLVIGKLAMKHLSDTQLLSMAKSLQFDAPIPFEFPIERSPAHVPADAIERAKVAAGFWNVDMSPMHGALLASIFARGGMYQPPHVIAQVIGPDGSDLTPALPPEDRVLGHDVAASIGEMMIATTLQGTAQKSFVDGQGHPYVTQMSVAGKTGSLTGKKAPFLNYNWFIGYAPADRPEVAFAVLLANEPAWRIKAHYAARRLVQIWIERRGELARQREAKLLPDALVLPQRDPSGALLTQAAGATTVAPGNAPGAAKAPDAELAAAGSENAPPPTAKEPAELPPPPKADALPPVPGPLPAVDPGA